MEEIQCSIMPQPKQVSDIAEQFAALSDRQQRVVTLVCEGLSNRAIAEKLDISEGTVKSHLHAIYDKLGVQSRYALAIACADRQPKT
jgi:DNA-binding NarL/FixJ family response regulator